MYRKNPQTAFNFSELIIDNFSGGGGATTGIEYALGRSVDVAINHNQSAIDMHTINHPQTKHYNESVWNVDPRAVCNGQPVGLAWFSPDCRHFSKAKGGQPVSKQVRGLAWVVLKWIGTVRPRVIMLENVEEFLTWGPLIENDNGKMVPDPTKKGSTFNAFVRAIKRHGYNVDWRQLRACDYGAPTIRKRLFLVARCDGLPIAWPKPTHGPGLKPYKTAADIIDWTLPCPSIFERKRPLAENTLRRIAEGIRRYVIEDAEPFIVNCANSKTTGREPNVWAIKEPTRTITTSPGFAVATPYLVPRYGERQGQSPRTRSTTEPAPTIVTTGNHAHLVEAFLAKHYSGVVGHKPNSPIGTVTTQDHHSLVCSYLQRDFGKSVGSSNCKPVPTITAGGGGHVAEVRAFLMKYYSEGGQWQKPAEPLHTVPTKARMGLVTIRGVDYQIVDIGMRMLQPHELYAAQGFPADYIFDRTASGERITKTEQIAKCGNSVPPPVVAALVKANYAEQLASEANVIQK
ncbi:DNA cytosine methyltransferase [Teredinibacter turnerae]|uniref:DNA cytosine methyltransferase n=1 Tax=Teredinibacter turnerae TaxID=2426 RepID=UPI0030D34698